MRHCIQCGRELHGPQNRCELRLRTNYAPSDLSFCGTLCLVNYLQSAPEHFQELGRSRPVLPIAD